MNCSNSFSKEPGGLLGNSLRNCSTVTRVGDVGSVARVGRDGGGDGGSPSKALLFVDMGREETSNNGSVAWRTRGLYVQWVVVDAVLMGAVGGRREDSSVIRTCCG